MSQPQWHRNERHTSDSQSIPQAWSLATDQWQIHRERVCVMMYSTMTLQLCYGHVHAVICGAMQGRGAWTKVIVAFQMCQWPHHRPEKLEYFLWDIIRISRVSREALWHPRCSFSPRPLSTPYQAYAHQIRGNDSMNLRIGIDTVDVSRKLLVE